MISTLLRLQVIKKKFFFFTMSLKERFSNLGSTVIYIQRCPFKKKLKSLHIRKKVLNLHSPHQFNLKISSTGKLCVTKI